MQYNYPSIWQQAEKVLTVACKFCGSVLRRMFVSEIVIHFCSLSNLNKRPVLVFPELLVCLNCGKAEFIIPKDELLLLVRDDAVQKDLTPGESKVEQFAEFDILEVQADGSERWVDSADSFSAALFQAELAGIESPGRYVIRNQRNEVLNFDTDSINMRRYSLATLVRPT
jgi:hypothetical protein